MSSPPIKDTDGYVLNRNFTASTRLNCQHYIWHRELGYNLHPSIPLLANQNARIADIATGTAAWLLDVAREHPTAQCDGFDISLAQAPPAAWLPGNVSLREWDFHEKPPEEALGQYDVVHIRLVILVIGKGDPVPVLRNLALLLKPGGWLQWDEVDTGDAVVAHPAGAEGKTEALERMAARMKAHAMGASSWVVKLPETMREVGGFVDAELYRVKADKAYLKFYTDMHSLLWVEVATHMPVEGGQRAQFEQLVEKVLEETEKGAAYGAAKVIVVGKKAMISAPLVAD